MADDHFVLQLTREMAAVSDAVFDYFELDNPFGFVMQDIHMFKAALAAVTRKRPRGWMVAIEGNAGSGKGTFIELLEKQENVLLITPKLLHQSMFTPYALGRNIIDTLRTSEKHELIPRGSDEQYRLIQELLYERKKDGTRVILAFDDGQQWTTRVLTSLKRLRELRYMGDSDLISVVFLGHTVGIRKLQTIEEASLRLAKVALPGFTLQELCIYVKRACGALFADEDTLGEFCMRCPDHRPLFVQSLLLQTLNRVMIRGGEKIESQDIESGLSLKQALAEAGISHRDLAKESKTNPTYVTHILNNKFNGDPNIAKKVYDTGEEMIRERMKEAS